MTRAQPNRNGKDFFLFLSIKKNPIIAKTGRPKKRIIVDGTISPYPFKKSFAR